MNADVLTFEQPTTIGPSLNEAAEQPAEEFQPRFVTPEQLRRMRREDQHRQRVLKKREQRWASPAADAKVEDLMLVAQDIKNLLDTVDVLNRELYLVRTALFNANVLKEENLTALRERHKERENKFKELQTNTTMSNEEKISIAKEFELPLHLLGLQEEPAITTTGDVQ